jgi:hypothetical protein
MSRAAGGKVRTSGVFSRATEGSRGFLEAAAIHAAYELGLYDALPGTSMELAARLGLGAARVRALLDVLVSAEALAREPYSAPPRFVPPARLPPRPPPPPPQGWGRIAEALRADRPLEDANAPTAGPELCAFHQHLAQAGAAPARELATILARELYPGEAFLDAGGGQGAYTAALLEAAPAAHATLFDRAPVIALARDALTAHAVDYLAGDLTETPLGGPYRIALAVNLLHLHGARDAAEIVRRLAAALVPGGWLVVQDLAVRPDRTGPAEALLFALNMALYTAAGDVHDAGAIASWLEAAGLGDVRLKTLAAAPDAMVLMGRRR